MLRWIGLILFTFAVAENCKHGSLFDVWNTYSIGPVIDKWDGYAAAYDENLCKFHDVADLSILEIGVQSGGSLYLWPQYFRNLRKIVGLDINPLSSQVHAPDVGIYVEIGSQSNATFLSEVCSEHGPFHIIIDDASHHTSDIIVSLRTLFPSCLVEGGTYVIEDTCMMSIFDDNNINIYEEKDLSDHFADIYRSIHHYWSPHHKYYDPIFSAHVYRISMYDSMVFIEKKTQRPLQRLGRGDWRIPNAPTELLHFPDNTKDGKYVAYEVDVGVNSDIAVNERLQSIYHEMKALCNTHNLHELLSATGESCAAQLTRQILETAYRSHWIFDEKKLEKQR